MGAEGPIPQHRLLQGRLVPGLRHPARQELVTPLSEAAPVTGEEPLLGQRLGKAPRTVLLGDSVWRAEGTGFHWFPLARAGAPLAGSVRGAPAAALGCASENPRVPVPAGPALLCSTATKSERDPHRARQQIRKLRVGNPVAASSSARSRSPRRRPTEDSRPGCGPGAPWGRPALEAHGHVHLVPTGRSGAPQTHVLRPNPGEGLWELMRVR